MEAKNDVSLYLEKIILFLLGALFLLFPIFFTTASTDAFAIPKQLLLTVVSLVTLILFGVKMISDGSIKIRTTPFDIPIIIFGVIVCISSLLAINRTDSLIAFVPVLLAIIIFYIIVNSIKNRVSLFILSACLVIGSAIASLITIFSSVKLYILPLQATHFQGFTPFGSLLDQAMYFAVILVIAGYYALPFLKIRTGEHPNTESKVMLAGFAIVLLGLLVTIYELFTIQKPVILPYEIGFQTAFAAISQDTGRILQGFLVGSGFGTYNIDYARFKPAAFNTNQTLWSFTFFRSSTFILELLATTGLLGLLSFLFIIFTALKETKLHLSQEKTNPFFFGFLLLVLLGFLLPFSFVLQILFFVLLGLLAAEQGIKHYSKFYDIVFYFVASKKRILPISTYPADESGKYGEAPAYVRKEEEKSLSKFLPVTFFVLTVLLAGIIGFFTFRFAASDVLFQNSLVAAAANNGLDTYNNETNAINLFPWRDSYYRIYSQTNLALASTLNGTIQPGSSPSAQTQQTIFTLIQQSINSARAATTIAPMNTLNWQNLSSVYRSIIGVGQNAETFAVLAQQQAIALDPTNPQNYINLGGIYYQLGQWDNAQRQFLIAIQLKSDLANAYYNLGKAYEQKGDLQNALTAFQAVQTLVQSSPDNLKLITEEINTLQQKIGSGTKPTETQLQQPATNQPPLQVSSPSAQLPQLKEKIKISPPPNAATSSAR